MDNSHSNANMAFSPPKDMSHYYSRVTARREASSIKMLYKYWLIPGMGNLAGGLPNPGYFPYDTLEAKVAVPTRFKPTPNQPSGDATLPNKSEVKSPAAGRILVPHDSTQPDRMQKIDLATALNYGTAQGLLPLFNFVKEFALTKLHPEIPYEGGADVLLTTGSTDGFSKTLEAFSNTWNDQKDPMWEREGILCEAFTYTQPIQAAKPRGLNIVSVAIDSEGMMADGPGGLAEVLENWDMRNGKLPHLMYTVTMGQNPTSGLLSVTRRKQIYTLCQQYDILIIEDDPYWHLQYPSANDLSIRYRGHPVSENILRESREFAANRKSSGSAFLDSLVPSYLSLDVEGRVIRLDTFSKTIAPGCRLGWVTAQPAIIERLLRITEAFTQQPSGFVQSMVSELILGPSDKNGKKTTDVRWQMDGWIRWLEGLRGEYEGRMQTMSQILEKGKYVVQIERRRSSISSAASDGYEVLTKSQIYDFAYPMAGMFLWVHCHLERHPLFGQYANDRLSLAMWVHLTRYKVMVAPGFIFASTPEILKARGWQYLRICFAAVETDMVEILSKRFVEAMVAFWQIEDRKTIDELLHDFDEDAALDAEMQRDMQCAMPQIC